MARPPGDLILHFQYRPSRRSAEEEKVPEFRLQVALSAAQPQESLPIANSTDHLFGTWLQPPSALVDEAPDRWPGARPLRGETHRRIAAISD